MMDGTPKQQLMAHAANLLNAKNDSAMRSYGQSVAPPNQHAPGQPSQGFGKRTSQTFKFDPLLVTRAMIASHAR